MRYALRLMLLALGVCIATFGLLYWQHRGFDFEGIWFHDENGFHIHPLHLVALGVAVVPPTIWDIFLLELAHRLRRADAETPTTPSGAGSATEAPAPESPAGGGRRGQRPS